MDITVIMPIFNASKYVEDAVESILNQRFNGSFELILVDDNSTDSTFELISKFENYKNIEILKNATNMGYPFSMNRGLQKAKGNYIVRMDADDVMHHDLLQLLHAQIKDNDEFCFVSCRRFFLTYSGKPYYFHFGLKDQFKIEYVENLRNKTRLFNDVGTIYRIADARKVGFYNTYQRSGMDVDFWFKLYEYTKKPSLTINEPLIGKRHLPDSIIFQKNTSVLNDIPRLLSDYRINKNLNPDFIPHASWIEQAKSKLEQSNGEKNNFAMIAHLLIVNLKFNDMKGVYNFFLIGIRRGGASFLRYVISEMMKSHSNYFSGFPKINKNLLVFRTLNKINTVDAK